MSASSISSGGGPRARLRLSEWLSLAAAPAFATLAVLQGSDVSCGSHAVGEMGVMYGLMAMFHLPPWLKLASGPTRSAL